MPIFITCHMDIYLHYGMEAFLFHCACQQMVSAAFTPQATSRSCWAAAWQTAGRSLDGCASAGAVGPRSDFFSNTITLVSISQVSLLVMEEEKHLYHLDALQIHSCEHILSVGDDIFVKLESACQTKNRWDCLNLDLDIEGPLQPCQLLFGHIGRQRTSADGCPHFTKFSSVSTLRNNKRMCMIRHHKTT